MSETGQEIRLSTDFGPIQVEWDSATQAWSLDIQYNLDALQTWNNWRGESKASLPGLPVLSPYLWTMSTIDLGGLELSKETFFPVGSTIQDPGMYFNDGSTTPAMLVLDLITDKLIDPSEIIDFTDFYSNKGSMYGMMANKDEDTTIIMGQYRFMTSNSNLAFSSMMRTELSTSFSSGEPTAASKLYCYRIIRPWIDTGITKIQIPSSRFYLTGVRDKEEDLVYLMRLKRSYELDQTQS